MIYKYLTKNIVNFDNRHAETYNKLGFFDHTYTIIIIIRNPFIRLISGFHEKYRKDGQFEKLWKSKKVLNFKNFVDELVSNSHCIENHHFTPQLSEEWNDKIYNHKNLKIYDLENIDYDYLEQVYNKKIPKNILQYRGHFRSSIMKNKKIIKQDNIKVYDFEIDKFEVGAQYSCDLYYNEDIEKKVLLFYKKDFDFFTKQGFNYSI
jgi:hypothetical protein